MKKVDILLATYNPNDQYFIQLLKSLDEQSYPNLFLIIRDDSSNSDTFHSISKLVKTHITSFDYRITANQNNLGSNKTFEKLTLDSRGDYVAYCDQDDIWEKDKLTKLVELIEKNKDTVLCYSDLSVIDKDGVQLAESFKAINRRVNHLYGNQLFKYFLRRNCITGCTMLIKSEIAKNAIPFCSQYYIHDHWLALFASSRGRISYLPDPLVQYRLHEKNQIGLSLLNNIDDKDDYYKKKLLTERSKYQWLLEYYKTNPICVHSVQQVLKWTEDRIRFFENKSFRTTFLMISRIKVDPQLILLELFINLLPLSFSRIIIKTIKYRFSAHCK
ncbi:glycosyltransferase [Tindallia californiensis]|uniref:Glycosyl transferase family 2 n=1 Tax=Tindallia californiensis TaxID=159292 RepID=A0A1H3PBG4_9FIRM|nr:glycosyltransferase [Tindallia californiensis]SDY98474.1 Glycosyl transferase family 2 [Tindallia californiensis]